ncbi:hypothetical protein MXL46_19070 [Heyndrickxia sporothermodurans]|uniref:hypothetical protein n=1 Tax=Bacillaceae TaxID=186817 RepID=UPI0010F519C6|nr:MULTISPECIES: hypothetical protein [Bacillaceae]MEB6551150.1 hypothetical protein [Heyndrickxia sporothermodurans]MED3781874.1 hypothetical protein [Heyndrickxia sporothermodurans]QTR71165.1 hypothetical protein JC775_00205 [Bacillus cytotoxicus]HDR7314296.1 hypothetical protein [Bacillus cytotoxicus]
MELILKRQDLFQLQGIIPFELLCYLEKEFMDLYEYYNANEDIENFTLENSQSMAILQSDEEVEFILQEPLEIEFVERISEGQLSLYRFGVRNAGEIQLFYCMEENFGGLIIEKLKDICS